MSYPADNASTFLPTEQHPLLPTTVNDDGNVVQHHQHQQQLDTMSPDLHRSRTIPFDDDMEVDETMLGCLGCGGGASPSVDNDRGEQTTTSGVLGDNSGATVTICGNTASNSDNISICANSADEHATTDGASKPPAPSPAPPLAQFSDLTNTPPATMVPVPELYHQGGGGDSVGSNPAAILSCRSSTSAVQGGSFSATSANDLVGVNHPFFQQQHHQQHGSFGGVDIHSGIAEQAHNSSSANTSFTLGSASATSSQLYGGPPSPTRMSGIFSSTTIASRPSSQLSSGKASINLLIATAEPAKQIMYIPDGINAQPQLKGGNQSTTSSTSLGSMVLHDQVQHGNAAVGGGGPAVKRPPPAHHHHHYHHHNNKLLPVVDYDIVGVGHHEVGIPLGGGGPHGAPVA